jgi:peptidoglycan/LPS O-acetylase OafA/YrhL
VAASQENYFPLFDYLRGALAIVVMLSHDGVLPWPNAGGFAVQVFFALSGWLIGGILLRMPPKELTRFYFNRAVRIWTPYYIALALLVIVSLLRDSVTTKWLEFVFYKASFVYNIFGPPQLAVHVSEMPLAGTGNHFWSVNAEEQFYLISPIILVLIAPMLGRNVYSWIAIGALAVIAQVYASIVFGVLAAVVVRQYGDLHRHVLVRPFLFGITAATAAGIAIGVDYDSLAPFCALGIVLLLAVRGRANRLGTVIGGMSYPLYLNHWIGVFASNSLLAPTGLRGSIVGHLLSYALNIAVATTHYWCIDRNMLALRGKLFAPELGQALAIAAYILIGVGIAFGILVADRSTR